MKQIGAIRNFSAGISDSPKVGLPGSFAFARSIDFRSDPTQFTINPKAVICIWQHRNDVQERCC